ncbi:MAG: hypothetical protein JJ863_37565 [Deltaproteobacteria bacterium]|nr:hypothetical protein [Deltaproteobacteria bacterium]
MTPRSPILRLGLHALLFCLACRQAPEGDPLLLEESFETPCDDTECEWAQVLGDPGGAEWVSTVHPGEHGLVIQPGVTVRKPYELDPRGVQVMSGALLGVASARCDPGGQLDFEVLVRDERGGADAYGGRPSLPTEWGIPISFALTSDFALSDGGMAIGTTTSDLEVTSILIRSSGSAPCTIDHLRVDGFNRAGRAPESACDGD